MKTLYLSIHKLFHFMQNSDQTSLTVSIDVHLSVEKVWDLWINPVHIVKWNTASPDWHTTHATNEVKMGGAFSSRMEAKDGSVGFDFQGTYTVVEEHTRLASDIGNGRVMEVRFTAIENGTRITETFTPENENSLEMQRTGWQAILDNFKKYAEGLG